MRLPRGTRLAIGLKLSVAIYVLAAALLPLAHHDLVCHLKTPSHCVTCVVGSSGDVAADRAVFSRSWMNDLGAAVIQQTATFDSAPLRASRGRAPPSRV
jgi:hypothetical protein